MRIQVNYVSQCLGRAVDVTLVIPSPTYPDALGVSGQQYTLAPVAEYPVIFLLHGVGNSKDNWLAYTRAELYAEENNIALVCVSAENKFYTDRPGEKWEEFLRSELIQLVSSYFPVSSRMEDRYIAGLSMGGYGAMLHALSQPELYRACGCFSGAIGKVDLAQCLPPRERYDIISLLKERAAEGVRLPDFYVSCGGNDFILDESLKLHNEMSELNIPHTWELVEGYTHEWRFWDMQLEKFISWLPRTDYYKGKKRNV